MIKVVFVDIDGTLTGRKGKITERTKMAIKNCTQKGIKVILSSGRSRFNTFNLSKEIGTSNIIISSNGADVYDNENNIEIYTKNIEKDDLMNLLDYATKNDNKIVLNYGFDLVMNKYYYEDEKDKVRSIEELKYIIETKKIVQCVILDNDLEKLKAFKEYFSKNMKNLKIENESKRLKDPSIKPSKNYYCDINCNNISKGKAVEEVCKYLNISTNEAMAIGDGENDISMFEVVKYSVAMGNALDNVKKEAKIVADSDDEDGAAKVLEQLVYHRGRRIWYINMADFRIF